MATSSYVIFMGCVLRLEHNKHTFVQSATTEHKVNLSSLPKTACVALSGFANVHCNRKDFKYDRILVCERQGLCHADAVDGGLVNLP